MAEATALLIGSWKCETRRPVRGEKGKHVITKKRGIRKVFAKYGEWYPPDGWVEGDIDNMKRLMHSKGVHVYGVFDYRERNKDGVFSLGKKDVLDKIRGFFGQDDKTHFVVYFTGHGDEEGSWVVPVTTAAPRKRRETAKPCKVYGSASLGPLRSDQSGVASPSSLAHVEVYSDRDTPSDAARKSPENPAALPPGVDENRLLSTPSVTSSPDILPQNEPGQKPAVKLKSLYHKALRERPEPTKEWNDLIRYSDVVDLWDECSSEKSGDRQLMLILECCHSGRWVQKVNGEFEIECEDIDEESVSIEIKKRCEERHDICIQAACRPSESTMVAPNQLSSVFTRAFVAAQNRSNFEKFALTLLDHMFVLNLVSIARSPARHQFSPVSSKCPPFGGIQFFNSFDEMHLNT